MQVTELSVHRSLNKTSSSEFLIEADFKEEEEEDEGRSTALSSLQATVIS